MSEKEQGVDNQQKRLTTNPLDTKIKFRIFQQLRDANADGRYADLTPVLKPLEPAFFDDENSGLEILQNARQAMLDSGFAQEDSEIDDAMGNAIHRLSKGKIGDGLIRRDAAEKQILPIAQLTENQKTPHKGNARDASDR